MSLFCLVHGSTQNASCWDLLIPQLQQRDHQTARINLPTTEPEASATRYAEIVAETIPQDCDDVVLVGHSASGLFLPLVPAKRPIRRLVFLAAVIPQIGKSLLDQIKTETDMLHADWIGEDPTKDDQVALHFLFHDCSPEIARWALTTLSLMYPRQAATEVCPLISWPKVPSSYVVCAEDRTIRPEWSRRAAHDRLGADLIELPGGPCPHVSWPAALAGALASL
jgi:hypothetical protein